MTTLTKQAAQQIRLSAKQGRMEGLALRVAAKHNKDGSIHYGMGFDDTGREDDLRSTSQGIELVISPVSQDLLRTTTIDYVELEPGKFHFVFINPDDPDYRPPKNETDT